MKVAPVWSGEVMFPFAGRESAPCSMINGLGHITVSGT